MCYTELKVKTKNQSLTFDLSGHDSLLPRHKPSSCELNKLIKHKNHCQYVPVHWSKLLESPSLPNLWDDFSENISSGSSESVKKQALKRVPIVSWLPQYNTLVSRLSHHHCHHHSNNFPEIVNVLILLST